MNIDNYNNMVKDCYKHSVQDNYANTTPQSKGEVYEH